MIIIIIISGWNGKNRVGESGSGAQLSRSNIGTTIGPPKTLTHRLKRSRFVNLHVGPFRGPHLPQLFRTENPSIFSIYVSLSLFLPFFLKLWIYIHKIMLIVFSPLNVTRLIFSVCKFMDQISWPLDWQFNPYCFKLRCGRTTICTIQNGRSQNTCRVLFVPGDWISLVNHWIYTL